MDCENKQSNDVISCDGNMPGRRPVTSFRTALGRARKQAEIDSWDRSVRALADELCKIVALIYVLPSENHVCIGGEIYPASVVAEVFEDLTPAHFDEAIKRLEAVKVPITNKRAYMTTVLFNSVFELESGDTNKVRSEW